MPDEKTPTPPPTQLPLTPADALRALVATVKQLAKNVADLVLVQREEQRSQKRFRREMRMLMRTAVGAAAEAAAKKAGAQPPPAAPIVALQPSVHTPAPIAAEQDRGDEVSDVFPIPGFGAQVQLQVQRRAQKKAWNWLWAGILLAVLHLVQYILVDRYKVQPTAPAAAPASVAAPPAPLQPTLQLPKLSPPKIP